MKLEEIQKDSTLLGIVPGQAVKVMSVEPIGDDALTVVYKDPDGKFGERMIFRSEEHNLSIQEAGRAWSLDGDANDFKLAAEAYRIHLAHLFDPLMAVHTSNVVHFLLMTATPHNGKDEDFQAFMALIDSDRFYGKFRQGVHQVDTSDLMRRMVKEELLKFDGTPLFPERRAHTVNYKLSDLEVPVMVVIKFQKIWSCI